MKTCAATSDVTRLVLLLLFFSGAASAATLEGELRTWHPLTVTFAGPDADEIQNSPNPFLDYRLQVIFTGPSGRTYQVPGFFDGDGQGGDKGNVWRVRFSPDEPGQWHYKASMRQGPQVAVSLDPEAGSPADFDGQAGNFTIAGRDASAPGFLGWGRLEYVGGHYLKFQDGPYWIRGGTDEPENLLAYEGFDNTPPSHRFADHLVDWKPGDPDWGDGRGRAMIGAINYLASRHVNSIYFLTMNIGGDGKDVWPWAGSPDPKGNPGNDNLHFDVGKLRQWEVVFDHAQRLGIFLHVVLNEAEQANKRELDDGELGVDRKLYYRELVARFGHHLAMEWNLCEEYNLQFDFGPERVRSFAEYLAAVDPYDHPITVHPARDPLEALRFTFGDPRFSLTSIQLGHRRIDELTESFRRATAAAGRPLPVSMDKFTLDAGQASAAIPVDDAQRHRREKLWPTYLSGGMIEFILEDLLETDSFKTPQREALWDYMWYARRFMEESLPFWEMEPADELVEHEATIPVRQGKGKTFEMGAQVFAKPGEVYAIYLPKANVTGMLDLGGIRGEFRKRWYNPRTGQFAGEPTTVDGGDSVPLGSPPEDPGEDWAILIQRMVPAERTPASSQEKAFYNFPPPGEGLDVQDQRTPQEAGLNPAIITALRTRKADRWALWRDGRLIHVEGEWNRSVNVASLRKTWHALTVGAAIDQGRIPSYHQKLSVWEKDLTGNDALATWWHVITQSSAFDYPYNGFPDYRPGEIWTYSDKNPVHLCNALAMVYGKRDYHDRYEDVLREAYFDAIGMRGWKIGFEKKDDGVRLYLDLEDMGRLGLLVLARGQWNGVQVIPRWFVEELECKQTEGMRINYDGPDDGVIGLDPKEFPEAPYGYMTWVNTDGDYYPGADRAWAWGSGAGGNVIFWNRNIGIVYAAQGLDRDQSGETHGIPHLIEENVAAPQNSSAQ